MLWVYATIEEARFRARELQAMRDKTRCQKHHRAPVTASVRSQKNYDARADHWRQLAGY